MIRIRLHGRGGQGMKTASRILGTALFLEGFEVQDAPRYGAERRGAPIFAYVRASREPIHERGIISEPGLIVVADETLVAIPEVLSGADEHTVLLIDSREPPDVWRERLGLECAILTLPSTAGDDAQKPFVGASCAGAAARLLGSVSRASVGRAVESELEAMSPDVVAANREQALGAYDSFEAHEGLVVERTERPLSERAPPAWIDLTVEIASASAPGIHAGATSVLSKTGAWRTMRPVLERERCKHCVWLCRTFCPDSVIGVDANGFPEVDYDHCKGCLVCTAVCPHHAMVASPEKEFATTESGEARSGQ